MKCAETGKCIEQISGCQGLVGREMGMTINVHRVALWDDENILEI